MTGEQLRFPVVDARDLLGRSHNLPAGFDGRLVVAMVAFRQFQQSQVDSWVPLLAEIASSVPGFHFYELPVLARHWAPVRPFIDGGMARGIGDPVVLARTLTIYGDVGRVCRPLQITDRTHITVVLTDRSGRVHWVGSGAHTDEAGTALRDAVEALSPN
jgi:hypothetical protein